MEVPQGEAAYNTIDKATPESFGGQVGQTLEQAGNMLAQHAVARQQLVNEANVNDVYANQFSPQFRELQNEFMKLEGQEAEARFPEYQQKMNGLRAQFRDGLPNVIQQKLFDDRSTRRAEMDLDGMSRYAASQTKAWEWNTHNAVLADLAAEGASNYNNPQRLQNVLDRIDNETIDYGSKHGWSPEVFQYQRGVNQDKLWSEVIKRQALADPAGAMRTYREQVSAGRISGAAQGELEKFFKPIQNLQSAQNAYGKVTGGAIAQAIAGEAQRQGVDPSTALTIWSAEGGVTNPATKNRDSTATGIFQHMSGTWSDLGGTDHDRLDAARQVQLGVALTKQNTDALAKDLGRWPQPWEVYLAHQQGIEGATVLLHADPNANAGDVMGNPKAITDNGGTADMTAGQFVNYIKGYVDRHSQMYAANGVPTAQNLSENYEAGLQALTDLARQEHPGDPQAEERYRSHFIQQAGQQIRAENMTNQANERIVANSLTGPAPVKSWQEFMSDPARVDAYNSLFKTDRSTYDRVDKAITINAIAAWDPPAEASTDQLYNQLHGMSATDRDNFSKLDLMQYYGGMPVSQFNGLRNTQQKIRDRDAAEAARQIDLNASLAAIRDVTGLAAVSPESPYYKMDHASPLLFEQQKWDEFVGRFGQAMGDWSQNNGGRTPSIPQEREIAQQILFPQGLPAQGPPAYAGAAARSEISGHSDTETRGRSDQTVSPSPSPSISAAVSPEDATTKNPPPDDTNTGTDINADTNVVGSNSKPDPMASQEDAGNKGEAVPHGSVEGHRAQAPRVDIYVYPRKDKGYDFVAINSSNPKVIQGQFNTTTTNWATDKVRPGDYRISYRPHIDVKSGITGIKQMIGAVMSGNSSGNVNKEEGKLALSNTNDWNTIKYENGTQLGGVMIHPGHDKSTGEGGSSLVLACVNERNIVSCSP